MPLYFSLSQIAVCLSSQQPAASSSLENLLLVFWAALVISLLFSLLGFSNQTAPHSILNAFNATHGFIYYYFVVVYFHNVWPNRARDTPQKE